MRDIIGYEGLYVWDGENVIGLKRGKILKWKYDRRGDAYVDLYKEGKRTTLYKHMFVWMYAHGKAIQSGYEIHHVDGDFANNDPSNLQLLTREEHQRLHGLSERTVNCFKDGKLIATYPSVNETSRQLKLNQGHISECCNGKRKREKGYQFSWA